MQMIIEELPYGGLVLEVGNSIKTRAKNGTIRRPFKCKNCGSDLAQSKFYFNKRQPFVNESSKFYCIACALKIGFIQTNDNSLNKTIHTIRQKWEAFRIESYCPLCGLQLNEGECRMHEAGKCPSRTEVKSD